MNWKEINEKYPKAFLEWVKTWEPKAEYLLEIDGIFAIKIESWMCKSFHTYYPSIEKLPYYFDSLGIVILPDGRIYKYGFNCIVMIPNVEGFYLWDENGKMIEFPDRLAATIAGATKAFEIREAQLNNN